MNRKQAEQLAPIIKAFGEGAEVQFDGIDGWETISNPSFDAGYRYRVKPKPREWHINIYPNNNDMGFAYTNESTAMGRASTGEKTIKVREILDDE